MTERLRVAIGATAYNEGRNLARLLERIQAVALPDDDLLRIVVVASGCTDDTVTIARRIAARDPRLHVVVDPERRGKAVAINQLIAAADGADIIVMESADTLPEPGAIAALVARFADPRVGMVGAHPVPEDDESTFVGYATGLLWRLHHAVASRSPKQGELVAWRNVVAEIPSTAVADEAYLEAALTRRGYSLAYAPEAVVRNRGPATVAAFVNQRRRNHAIHRVLEATERYRPATRDHLALARLALGELARRPSRAAWLVAAAAVEAWSALLGWWDFAIAHRSHAVWSVVEGTKELARTVDHPVRVTAVIVSYDSLPDIRPCLESLRRSDVPVRRVIVVDNGGRDAIEAALRTEYPEVEVVRLEENGGLARGFNAGVRAALDGGCEFVLQLNPDVTLARDWLREALPAALADPRAATVSGPIFYESDPERVWYAGAEISWWLGKTYHRGRRVIWGPAFARPRLTGYSAGAAVLVSAAALRAVGPWDERYFLVFEETDWCVRASRRGWRHRYVPGARAWHRVSASFGGEKSPLYLYFLFRNNVLFMRRHARIWHWPSFLAFFAVESLARYSIESALHREAGRSLAAIWLAALDALRGRTGAGSAPRLAPATRPLRAAGVAREA